MILRGAYKTDEKIKFDVALGRTIRKVRKKQKVTQLKLSKLIGIDEKQLSRYEYGDCGLTAYRLNQICKALGISTSEVINNI